MLEQIVFLLLALLIGMFIGFFFGMLHGLRVAKEECKRVYGIEKDGR